MKNQKIKTASAAYGENVNLASIVMQGRRLSFRDRVQSLHDLVARISGDLQHLYFRPVHSKAGREVSIIDPQGRTREMLMFGSNNYLGLANHPHVVQQVTAAIRDFGIGVGGPPLLNGYTSVMRKLEERLSALKGTEDTMIFSSGYNANVGLISGLCNSRDIILADEYSHASFFDGVKMIRGNCYKFKHNGVMELEDLLKKHNKENVNLFVAVEGVYSMDGDIAPLDRVVPLCKKYGATLLVDDAHGTGVLGNGGGVHDHFKLPVGEDIILGTFSKAFAVNGGFISASRPVINYLRLMARSYMFSASLPPVTISAVLAGIEVIEKEPWRVQKLRENVAYAAEKLMRFGLACEPQAAIIALKVPPEVNIRNLARQFNEEGIFVNAVEYPAVPLNKQRFRISLMTDHTTEDIDRLVETVEMIWNRNVYQEVA